MNQSLAAPIRKANPGTFQSDHEVIRQFVVRNREFDIVMEILRGNTKTSSCQHVLLVAPRGRGKTMLLARVAAELRVREDLSRDLLPVRFMEESHEVFDMADFWLECLFHLSRESAVCAPELRSELRDTHRALSARGRQEELIEAWARTAVLDAADRLGKRIVLMVENLQDLSGDVDERFGWKLREELQTQPQVMLLATATSRFRGLDDATQPFFELFRILGLDPLDTEECRLLWHVLSGDALQEREIRPLQILTGGSPRLVVFVADFVRHRSVRQLMEQLVKLIDDHTEYFRSHLEGFAKTERRVYLATVDLWEPSTAGEITVRARLDTRTVSTMIGRLLHRGALISEGAGRRRRYSASERLYTIYYKLRRERDEAAVVSNLIRFMVMFYSQSELASMTDALSIEAAQSLAIRQGIQRTLTEAANTGDFVSPENILLFEQILIQAVDLIEVNRDPALIEAIIRAIKDGNCQELIALVDRFLDSRSGKVLRSSTPFVDLLVSARLFAHAGLGNAEAAIASYQTVVERFSASDDPALQRAVAMALFNLGNQQGRLGKNHAAIASYEEVVKRHIASDTLALQVSVAKSLFNKAIIFRRIGDSDTEVATYGDVVSRYGASDARELQIWVAQAIVNIGNAQGRLGKHHAAIASYNEVVCRYGASGSPDLRVQVAMALSNTGFTQSQLGNINEGNAAYAEVVKRYGDSGSQELQGLAAKALAAMAVNQFELADIAGEVATYEELIRRYEDSDSSEVRVIVATALVNKGSMQIGRNHPRDALHACKAIEGYGSLTDSNDIAFAWWAAWLRTRALVRCGRHADAIEAFHSMYAEFRPTGGTITKLLELTVELIAFGVPEREIVEIVASDRDKAGALAPLVVALRIRAGEEVRAPLEVMEVAEDILKQLDASQ
ncbi:MAG: hypothetical protein OXJ90_27005 [Spirochaetaceae bacterium]|nr:hypothetical protein [Spirochaetaceae bacterium]